MAGNFHFAPGKSFQQSHVHGNDVVPLMNKQSIFAILLVHDLQPFGVSSVRVDTRKSISVGVFDLNTQFNISHTFHRLSFGTDYPGIQNPLDGRSAIDNAGSKYYELFTTNLINAFFFFFFLGSMMYQYFVKVVPTVYKKLSGKVIRTNQYSVTKHEKGIKLAGGLGEQGLPGLFVLYDLSPMMVQITESRR